MLKKLLTLLLMVGGTSTALAKGPAIGVGVTVGTLGAGLTLTTPIASVLNARLLVAGLDINHKVSSNDLDYKVNIRLFNAGALLDNHPFHNGLRASHGLIYTLNRFECTAVCQPSSSTCDAGHSNTVAEGDRLKGKVDYSGSAPYVGIGWGNAVDKSGRFSFSLDLGAMFIGSPAIDVRCEQASDPNACNAAAQQDAHDLKHNVGKYDIYSVLSLGLAYRI